MTEISTNIISTGYHFSAEWEYGDVQPVYITAQAGDCYSLHVEEYSGVYGVGYKLHIPNTKRYHTHAVAYVIRINYPCYMSLWSPQVARMAQEHTVNYDMLNALSYYHKTVSQTLWRDVLDITKGKAGYTPVWATLDVISCTRCIGHEHEYVLLGYCDTITSKTAFILAYHRALNEIIDKIEKPFK